MKTTLRHLALFAIVVSPLHAQEARTSADPFARSSAPPVADDPFDPLVVNRGALPTEPIFVSICFESFSIDLAEAAKLHRERMSDVELYRELISRTENGGATQEVFAVIRARSGQRATVESISEQIYPTDYRIRGEVESSTGEAGALHTGPPVGHSYETRNTGLTFEVEPNVGQDKHFVDLRFIPELVTMVDRAEWGQGISTTEMPTFESQRVNTALTLLPGRPTLWGTQSRPPVSQVDPDSANRVWFSFVTVDIVLVTEE